MRKIYSLILLASFMIGVSQPIMPMVEYGLYQGNISSLILDNKIQPDAPCDEASCFATNYSDCENRNSDQNSNLLDTDFYPIPIKVISAPEPAILPEHSELYSFFDENLINHFTLPLAPPPKEG